MSPAIAAVSPAVCGGVPGKRQALILDVGGHIKPFLTPDDPDAVLAAIRERSNAAILAGVKGPVI